MKINKSNYQGYLWYSDSAEPQIIKNEDFELDINDDANPFIIEGQLFDGKNSISIKYVDGKHLTHSREVSEEDIANSNGSKSELGPEYKEFLPNRMPGISALKFLQYWEGQKDDLCEGMNVLQPTDLVFFGFKDGEK